MGSEEVFFYLQIWNPWHVSKKLKLGLLWEYKWNKYNSFFKFGQSFVSVVQQLMLETKGFINFDVLHK